MRTEGLSINLATVREQWPLREAVEACARHGIGAVDPWRDQVAAAGLAEAARIIQANGMLVTGYCRGGMFPAQTPPAARRRSTTTGAPSTKPRHSARRAWCWCAAACRAARATSAPPAPW